MNVIFVEFSPANSIHVNDYETNYFLEATNRIINRGGFPEIIGNEPVSINNIFSLLNKGPGDWIQVLLPYLNKEFDCKYHLVTTDNMNNIILEILQTTPDDLTVLLLNIYSSRLHIAEEFVKSFRKCREGDVVVLGGPHVTALPVNALTVTGADIAVIGEADHLIGSLCRSISMKRIFNHHSVIYSKHLNVHKKIYKETVAPAEFRNMSWEFFFKYSKARAQNNPRICFNRLCQGSCFFCVKSTTINDPDITEKGVAWINQFLTVKDGITFLDITDPDFDFIRFSNEGMFEYFRKHNIYWQCMTRARKSTKELQEKIQHAAQSGCKSVFIGGETLSDRLLRSINKKSSSKDFVRLLECLKTNNIFTCANFILGLPWQSKKDIDADVSIISRLVKDGLLDLCGASYLMLFPGTVFYKFPSKFGITVEDQNMCNLESIVQHSTSLMTRKEITSTYNKTLEKFIGLIT